MDVHELTAAYALDALDDDERARYEEHLGQCARCREELAGLSGTAAALAWGAASPAPPPALRGRILAAAAAGRENVAPLRRGRPWALRVAAAAAAVAACAAIGLGAWAATLSHSLDSERSAHAAEVRAVQIWMNPASTKIALRGRSGMLAVDPAGLGVLVVHELPAAPSGMTYEAWVIPAGAKPIRAGTFRGGGSTTMFALDGSIPTGAVVAATLEHGKGSDAPTDRPLLTART